MMKNEMNLKEIKDGFTRENKTSHEGIKNKYKIKEEQKASNKRLINIKDIYEDINDKKQFGELINKEKSSKIKPKFLLSKKVMNSEKNIISIEKIKLENNLITIVKNQIVTSKNITIKIIHNIYLFLLKILFYFPYEYLNISIFLYSNQLQSININNKEHILLLIIFIINYEEKRREDKRSYYYFTGRGPQNDLPCCEKGLFKVKCESNNTCKINYDKIKIKYFIKLMINKSNEGKKYNSENRNVILELCSFIIIKSCNIINIIIFKFFNLGTEEKNNFLSFSDYKKNYCYNKEDSFYYNHQDKYKKILPFFITNIHNSFVIIIYHCIIFDNKTSFIISENKINFYNKKCINYIDNFFIKIYKYITFEFNNKKENFYLNFLCQTISKNYLLFIIMIILIKLKRLINAKRKFDRKIINFIQGIHLKIIYSGSINKFIEFIQWIKDIIINNIKKRKINNNNNKIKLNEIKKLKKTVNENKIMIRTYIILIKTIQIINIFNQLIAYNKYNLLYFHQSYITLKIRGPGWNNFLGNDFKRNNYPNEIIINNKSYNLEKKYNFEEEDNYVKLIWKDNINSSAFMFSGCKNITEIDLSHFNTSNIITMRAMFFNCSSLYKLNLSNIDISQVTNMGYMFQDCSSLVSLDFSYFNTPQINFMKGMFSGCSSLTSLNLYNFDTSQVTDMRSMFYHCSSLKSIELSSLNLSHFDTSHVTDMLDMFVNCSTLESLDLSNFDTSSVEIMKRMFANCSSLKSLDLSNFNISSVVNLNSMFLYCSSLEYLNLSNFITTSVTNMGSMFYGCSNLTYLDLSSFDTSKVTYMRSMFYHCSSLKSIELSSFNTSQVKDMAGMFYNCSKIESLDLSHFDTSQVTVLLHMFRYCSSLISLNLTNFNTTNVTNMVAMFQNCSSLAFLDLSNFNTSGVTDMNSMFSNCSSLEYLNLRNFDGSKLTNMKGIFLNVPKNIAICIQKTDKIFSNIRIICDDYYHYVDIKNNFHCLNKTECPKEYPKLLEDKKECIEYNIQNMKIIIKDKETEQNVKNETVKKTKEEEKVYYEEVLEVAEEFFKSDDYDTSKIDNGEEEKIETEKMTITFTTTQNQKDNIDIYSTSIDIGECETLLRRYYNISSNESLYIKKIDIAQEGMKTSKVGYDVYCKLFGKGLVKLNLTACEDTKISISIPIVITDSIDKLNSSSGYYNDICYTTTTEDGTDITLKDRKNEYAKGDKIICQEDCDFTGYDYKTYKAKCLCKAKESSSSLNDFNIDKTQLLKNIKDIKNIANFNFLICYKKLFNLEGIKKNVGSYLLISIIILHLFNIIIFYIKQFPLIKNKIKEIVFGINENDLLEKNKKTKKKKTITNKENKNKKKIGIKKKVKKKEKSKNLKGTKTPTNINTNTINNNLIFPDKDSIANKITLNNSIKKIESNDEQNKIDKIKNIMKYIDEEINSLPYDLAIQCDKRSYCEYYISLLKTKHCLIFALFNNNDYNSNIIKIDLFFIGFAIDYIVNALFYDDDTMHKIYESRDTIRNISIIK